MDLDLDLEPVPVPGELCRTWVDREVDFVDGVDRVGLA